MHSTLVWKVAICGQKSIFQLVKKNVSQNYVRKNRDINRIVSDHYRETRIQASSKFIPRILTGQQKQNRKQIVTELLQQAETDEHFLKEIITEDETWVYEYNVETNAKTSCNQVNRLKKMSSDRRKHA